MTGGELKAGPNTLTSYAYLYLTNSWSDFVVQARLRFPAGAYGGGIGGRLNPATGAHYGAWVYPDNSPGGSNVLKLVKFQTWQSFGYGGIAGGVMAQASLPPVGTNWHSLRAIFQGANIQVEFDGVGILAVQDTDAVPLSNGGISLDLWTDTTAYQMSVDDVVAQSVSGPPVAVNDSYAAVGGHPLVVPPPGVLNNDLSLTNSITTSLVSGPASGTLAFNTNGSFSYTPLITFSGSDNFTYQVVDAAGTSGVATVTLSVTPNHTPQAVGDAYGIGQGRLLSVPAPGVLANDSDPDGDALSAVLVSATTNGALSLQSNGGFAYSPALAFTGTDAFQYAVSDGFSTSAPVTVTIQIVPGGTLFYDGFERPGTPAAIAPWVVQSGTWGISSNLLHGGNTAPGSYAFAYLTNSWTNYAVEARVRFPTGAFGGGLGGCLDPLTGAHYAAWLYPENLNGSSNVLKLIKFQTWSEFGYGGVSQAPVSQVNLASVGTNWHTLKLGFLGREIAVWLDGNKLIAFQDPETVAYTRGAISIDTWSGATPFEISVDDVKVDPLAADDAYVTPEDVLLTIGSPGVLANDTPVFPGTLTAVLVTGPVHGTLAFSWTGAFTYAPETNFYGQDSFTYQALEDGVGLGMATVNITVSPVNDPPVLPVQTNLTVAELTLLLVTNAASDADLPANTLSYVLEDGPAGAVIDTNGVINWTPSEAEGPGVYTLTTVVTDSGVPPLSATNSFMVTVEEMNTAPVLPVQTNLTVAELTLLLVTNTASDADLPANTLSYVLENAPAGAVIDTNGVISWTPSEAQGPGAYTLTTVVTDNGVPPLSATNSFTVTVEEVNTAPVLPVQTNLTVAELTLLTVTNTASDADLPANTLSYVLENAPAGAVIDTNGVIAWTPSEGEGPGVYTLTTVVTDSGVPPLSATNSFTVTVEEVNTAPALPVQTNLTVAELTLLLVTNTASDADLPVNTLSYVLENAPAGAVIDTNGVIAWTPSEGEGPGVYTLTTVVTDNGVPPLSATNSFTVTVEEVNTAPVLPVQTNLTMAELTLLLVTNTATDADLPANTLSYVLENAPAGAVIDTNGVISWTPSEAEGPGVYTLTTVVTDNGVPPLSATNSFTVTVEEVNTAPVLPVQTNVTVAELTFLLVTNTASDADLPANTLSYVLENAPAGAVIDTNGVISWTPSEAQGPGVYTLTTVVTDNGVPPLSATNSFTVTVEEMNTAPVLPVQTNLTVVELTLLLVTNTATDADLPANTLTYVLENAPSGAVIDTNGVIAWTPSEAQGPGVYTLTTVVTDNGVPPWSATNSFTVTVEEVNTAPMLPVQTNVTVAELTLLLVTNTASDADLPANTLSYVLENGPAGAVIDTNGVISWTPSEAQGPGVYTLTTVVTDNGVPPLSATNSFTVTVEEVNTAPVLPVQTNLTVAELTLLFVTNTATDADLPANTLSYVLENAPPGAVIDTNGVIAWTPSEAEGLGVYTLTTVVTDNGLPPLSATNSFMVTVEEVNTAPVLPVQTNLTMAELTLLLVTNTASDADLPANTLSYVLENAPAGAVIDTNGVISWTPSEAEGPGVYTLTTVVTDNGVPPLSATNSFTVTVEEMNTAPVLPVQTNLTVAELTLLLVTNTATDADLPANTLSYILENAPAGALIDTNGVISWTPSEAQGPGVYTLTTVVTDDGVPPLSVTNSFTVTVEEVNTAPVLPAQTNLTVAELTLLLVTNTASDADLPANTLSYVLENAPAGAVIGTNGVISWTPSDAQGPGAYTLTTVVTDNGLPPLSATNQFTVFVTANPSEFRIESLALTNGVVTVTWHSLPGRTYQLQVSQGLEAPVWQNVGGFIVATDVKTSVTNHTQGAVQQFYRVAAPAP